MYIEKKIFVRLLGSSKDYGLFLVALLVFHQMIRPNESSAANGAGKLLFPGVHAFVPRQFVRTSKSPVTVFHWA